MKQTLILDSTQIDTFLECPTLHDLGYRQSLTLNDTSDKDAISMGTLGHKWLEIYYYNRASGSNLSESVSRANRIDPDKMDNDPLDDHKFPLSGDKREQVLQRCQEYWMTYSQDDYIPDYKCVYDVHIDHRGLPIDTVKKIPLIEQGFSHKLYEDNNYLFILEGRIDFIGTHNYNQFFMDHKFQLRERKLYTKSIQFKNYAMVTGLNLGIINYIRLHKEPSAKTFIREPISFNSIELKRWRSELIEIYIEMAKQLKDGKFRRNWNACSGKFGYPCQFTPICEESKEIGELIKIQNYKKKKEWRPW